MRRSRSLLPNPHCRPVPIGRPGIRRLGTSASALLRHTFSRKCARCPSPRPESSQDPARAFLRASHLDRLVSRTRRTALNRLLYSQNGSPVPDYPLRGRRRTWTVRSTRLFFRSSEGCRPHPTAAAAYSGCGELCPQSATIATEELEYGHNPRIGPHRRCFWGVSARGVQ